MMRLYWVLGWVIASGVGVLSARPFTVVVYNVENLFDADGEAAYEDYQPAFYRPAHVLTKITNIARVLQQYEEGRGPDLVLLQEIEIDRTRPAVAYSPEAVLRAYADTRLDALLGPELSPEVRDWPAEVLLLKGLTDRGLMGYTVVTADEPPETHPQDGRPRAVQCVLLTRFPVRVESASASSD